MEAINELINRLTGILIRGFFGELGLEGVSFGAFMPHLLLYCTQV
jgi:hypothetical protein